MPQGFFDDPATLALLGMSAGFGSASGPSRMPVPLGLAVGGGARGMMEGGKAALDAQRSEAETALGNAQAQERLLPLNVQRQYYGMSPLGNNGLPAQAGAETPNLPSDLSKIPLLVRSAMKIPVSPAQWLLATNGVGMDDPRFQRAGQLAAMKDLDMGPKYERGYYMTPNTETMGMDYHPIATGVSGTVPNKDNPSQLEAPPANIAAVRSASEAQSGGHAAGEASMEPAPATVGPGGEKSIPTNPDGSPMSRQQFMQKNPMGYIKSGYGDGGPLDQVTPFARTVAMGYEGGMGKNTRSTAEGFGQFLDGTFIPQAQKLWPGVFGQSGTTPQVSPALSAAFKNEPVLMAKAIDAYAQQNTGDLVKAGINPTYENLLLAHRFGAAGAAKLLQANPKTMAGDVLGPKAIMQNPDEHYDTTPISAVIAKAKMAAQPMYQAQKAAPGTPKVNVQAIGPAAASGPTAAAGGPMPASGSMEEALGQEAKLFKMPPNTIEPPANLADARKRANEGTQELDKEANSAQAVKQTTRAIFSVLNNPNFDPKGAQPALLPIANALEALGVPKETVDSKIINVPSAQELSKNYMQLVGPMVKSLGERATRAVELWQEGFPNPALQKEAQVLMTNIIDQWAQRSVDEQKAYRNWMTSDANPHRTAETFDAWFNHTNPGESYTAKAYAAAQKQYSANFKPSSSSHDVLIPSLAEGDPGSEAFWELLPSGTVARVSGKTKPVRKP